MTSASTYHASPTADIAPSHFGLPSTTFFLPTPDPTPTDLAFAAQQFALKSPAVVDNPNIYAPLPKGPAYCLNGMLQYDDEVLNGQLSFSRRGMLGHCSRDTADLWSVTVSSELDIPLLCDDQIVVVYLSLHAICSRSE